MPTGESAGCDLIERLDAYGRCLGLAFQITDDLLDVEGRRRADRANGCGRTPPAAS